MLTGVICHGWGCWLYLTSHEGMGCGSSWNWECASLKHFRLFSVQFVIIVYVLHVSTHK